jgi:hypothetical protein
MAKNQSNYRGGPEVVIGKPRRYRAGRGIRKVGDPHGQPHGAVRIIVASGIVVDAARLNEIRGGQL